MASQTIFVLPVTDSFEVFYSPMAGPTEAEGDTETSGLASAWTTDSADDTLAADGGDAANGSWQQQQQQQGGTGGGRGSGSGSGEQPGAGPDPAHLLLGDADQQSEGRVPMRTKRRSTAGEGQPATPSVATGTPGGGPNAMDRVVKSYDRFMLSGDRDGWKAKVVRYMRPKDDRARMLQSIDSEVGQVRAPTGRLAG